LHAQVERANNEENGHIEKLVTESKKMLEDYKESLKKGTDAEINFMIRSCVNKARKLRLAAKPLDGSEIKLDFPLIPSDSDSTATQGLGAKDELDRECELNLESNKYRLPYHTMWCINLVVIIMLYNSIAPRIACIYRTVFITRADFPTSITSISPFLPEKNSRPIRRPITNEKVANAAWINNHVLKFPFSNPIRTPTCINANSIEVPIKSFPFEKTTINAGKVPSISKVLNETMPKEQAEALRRWEARMIAQMGEDRFREYKQGCILFFI